MTVKKSVGVLMGGISPEHPVSLVSGCGMLKNLDTEKYQGFPILISKDNVWCWPDLGSGNSAASTAAAANALVDSPEKAAACILNPPQGWHIARFPDFKIFPHCDLMLIGLHGVGGEDGRLQGFFELAGQKFTGSSSLGSALAMDKITAKRIYQACNIPTARYRVLEKDDYKHACPLLEKEFGFPMVIKSPQGGSSIGMGIAKTAQELEALITRLGESSERLLVEEFIKGREGTCGVLAGFKALSPSEIRPTQDEFFNFEAKYKPGRTEEITPADFPESILKQIQELALRCHQALQLSVYSRTDFIYARDQLFVLETNNLPGFTPTSLLPQAAAYAGLSYQNLLTKIIEESFKK
jgi:D-alanine-D-alanine ligase